MAAKELVAAAFSKWLKPLGLLWWDVRVNYYDDPGEVVRIFRDTGQNCNVLAITYANWMYAQATIDINLPAFKGLTQDEVERAIVHECIHILVSEMREGKVHHEERVVTTLTKAFFWVEAATNKEVTDAPNNG